MDKVLVLLVSCLLLVSALGAVSYFNDEVEEDNVEDVYQGPVPQGYDEEHFRKTGETIKEVEI